MPNAAHELIGWFEDLRAANNQHPVGRLSNVANDRGVDAKQALRTMGLLANRVDLMMDELRAAGHAVDYFEASNEAWTLAAFRYGAGWVGGGAINADDVVHSTNLGMLKAFAALYDASSMVPKPNKEALKRFVVELEPIAEFIRGLEIADSSKTLILSKIESAKVMLEEDDVRFDVVLTKLGEILGLMMILAESLPSEEDKETMWSKAKGFAANFGKDMTVNILSGAISSVAMGAIGV